MWVWACRWLNQCVHRIALKKSNQKFCTTVEMWFQIQRWGESVSTDTRKITAQRCWKYTYLSTYVPQHCPSHRHLQTLTKTTHTHTHTHTHTFSTTVWIIYGSTWIKKIYICIYNLRFCAFIYHVALVHSTVNGSLKDLKTKTKQKTPKWHKGLLTNRDQSGHAQLL